VPEHTGRRRKQSRVPIGRLAVLAVAVALVVFLLTLRDPSRGPDPASSPFGVAPTWAGPKPVDITGALADGAVYTPRLFLTAETSVGVAASADGTVRVILTGPVGPFTELRHLPASDNPQINGFAVGGDTLVWMETTRSGSGLITTLWRTTWKTGAKPTQVTTNTGEVNFYGLESDVVVADGSATWTAIAPGQGTETEVRTVALTGGQVSIKRLAGEYVLTTRPWAVSIPGGQGNQISLVNLSTDAKTTVTTGPTEVAVCSPTWCRLALTSDSALVGIDLMRPDGSQRRRIAGAEATPTIADPILLDRYVPLATDRGDGGVGLSLYDVETGRTDLVTPQAANVQGRNGILWWSTGAGSTLTWHAVDLRQLP
jgi:hypothetical protein